LARNNLKTKVISIGKVKSAGKDLETKVVEVD
jgi:hypothetical protein